MLYGIALTQSACTTVVHTLIQANILIELTFHTHTHYVYTQAAQRMCVTSGTYVHTGFCTSVNVESVSNQC